MQTELVGTQGEELQAGASIEVIVAGGQHQVERHAVRVDIGGIIELISLLCQSESVTKYAVDNFVHK